MKPAAPPRSAALWGWLASDTVSLMGTRLSMIAIPWLVLTTTGSAVLTGVVAKHALVPAVVDAAGVSLERATGPPGASERLASTVGAAAAGALVAAVGPATALAFDAASFGVSALLLTLTAPRSASTDEPDPAPYLARLREGWDFLRREPVLLAMTTMVAVSNLLDGAFTTVLVPVWAQATGVRRPAAAPPGLSTALLLVGAAYLVVTLSPLAVPAWRTMDDTRPGRADPGAGVTAVPDAAERVG